MDNVNQLQRDGLASTSPDSAVTADREISLMGILIALAERKRFIFMVSAVFSLLAIGISLLQRNVYTAKATIMAPLQASSLSGALSPQLSGVSSLSGMASLAGGNFLKNPNEIYAAMLKSNGVEDAMVQRFGLMQQYKSKLLSDARKAFEANTLVDANAKDNLIYISVTDYDPQRAAELANGYVDQFRELTKRLAITEAGRRRLFFEQQLQETKSKLADAEDQLKKTEQRTGLIQMDNQSRALIESVTNLRSQIALREMQLQAMRSYAASENSQLLLLEQELISLRAQLAKLGGEGDSASAGVIVPKGSVPEASLEYMRALRELKFQESVFEILSRQYEGAKLDEAREGAVIQVVDPATPPDRKSGPHRSIIVLGATAVGFFLGVVLSLFQISLRSARKDALFADELQRLRQALSLRRAKKLSAY
jgi:uncharacterized protein involved in exopolysaccharide biosynthesis